ncbi:YeeE/YedE family protein [Marinomonas ostreistagni]|uniref:YeeE/YedE family protein n=1 Tax=Marinomonas ostreistagni TaxID=359209 RepID=UPI00195249EC|nr:YeeE/YedE thiosulfate transporter family protein [Marinomonas ostreistagni]MBM6550232.1 YeeE/YedE family protein [Marinomonas ostreistagni]
MDSWTLPLLGGLLIGLATALYLLILGKVVGISGLLANALFNPSNRLTALVFIAGLIIGGSAYGPLFEIRTPLPEARAPMLLIISGLLVGYGTRLANGCTSGHGVCGLARFSLRSWVATTIFISVAIITVALVQ